MPYDIVDANRDIETLATQGDFLMRVCQKLNELVVKGGSKDVFQFVREEMESEATKGEEEVEDTKKKTGRSKASPI